MDVPVTEITVVGEVLPISACEDVACVGEEVVVEDQVVMIDDASVHYITDISYQEEEVIDDTQISDDQMLVQEEPVVEVGEEIQIIGEEGPTVSQEVELIEEEVSMEQPSQQIEEFMEEDNGGVSEVVIDVTIERVDADAGNGVGEYVPDEVVEETVDDSVYLSADERMPDEIMQPESTAEEEYEVAMETTIESSPQKDVQTEIEADEESTTVKERVAEEEATVDTTTEDVDNVQSSEEVISLESDSDDSHKEEINIVHSTAEPQKAKKKPKRVPFENPFESCGDGSDEDIFLGKSSTSKKPDTTVSAAESSRSDKKSGVQNSVENEKSSPKMRVPILESDWLQHHSTISAKESSSELRELPKKRWKRRHTSTEAKESVNSGSSDGQTPSPASTPQEEIAQPVLTQPVTSPQKRGRGRPRKSLETKTTLPSPKKSITNQMQQKTEENSTEEKLVVPPVKKRGRPRKSTSVSEEAGADVSRVKPDVEESTGIRGRLGRNSITQQVSIDSDFSDTAAVETSEPNKTTPSQIPQDRKTETPHATRKRKISEEDTVSSPHSTRGQVGVLGKRVRRDTEEEAGDSEQNSTADEGAQQDPSKTKRVPMKKSELNSVEGMFAKIAEQAAMAAAAGKEVGRSKRLRTRTEPSTIQSKTENENTPASIPKADLPSRKQTDRQRTKSVPLMEKQNQRKTPKKKGTTKQKENIAQEPIHKLSPPERRPCYMKVNDQLNSRPGFKSKPGQVFVSGTYICDECSFHTTRQNLIIQHYKDHFRSPSILTKKVTTSSSGRGRGRPRKEHMQSVFGSSVAGFDLDDDSVDLPAAFPESPVKAPPHVKGDLVWVKIKQWPFWPAVVRNIYLERRKLKKISVKFIGVFNHVDSSRGYCLNYNKRTTVPFAESHHQHARLKEEGKESDCKDEFLEAVTKAEDFVRKKVLGLPLDSIEFFDDGMSDVEVDSCVGNPLEPASGLILEGLGDDAELGPEGDNEYGAGDGFAFSEEDETYENSDLSEAQKERNAKIKAKQENLVKFIKTDKTKNYLYTIYQGGTSSDLHNLYQTGGEARRRLRFNSTYGPIEDTELEDEIFMTLKSYFQNLFQSKNYDVHYILDVWAPEAIVYALMNTQKYSKQKAWDIFRLGVQKTKTELEKQHTELLEGAAKIDEESKARYDLSFEHNLQLAKQSLSFSD